MSNPSTSVRQASTSQCRALPGFLLSGHARERIRSRQIPLDGVEAVLSFGRMSRCRGVHIFSLGAKDVRRYRAALGIDLSLYQEIQVICTPARFIVTVYRKTAKA